MPKLSTNKDRYEELIKNPLLFLHRVDHSYTDWNGDYVENISWEPINKDFNGNISKEQIIGNERGMALVVAELVKQTEDNDQSKNSTISFEIHEINATKQDDWRLVINSFIIRSQSVDERYPYLHLLWMLNYCKWDSTALTRALNIYDAQSHPFIIGKGLSLFCRCLSKYKQEQVQKALANFGYRYNVYVPSVITEAVSHVLPDIEEKKAYWNLFKLVDYVLVDNVFQQSVTRSIEDNTNNLLLILYRWLHNENATIEVTSLRSLFSISSNAIQLDIIKRYFHDIRLNRVLFDPKVVEEFKDNPFVDFIRYRYCLETPDMAIDLAVPLLCDCIITLFNSNGQTFQSFDGILDFAMMRCDIANPSISLGMEKFLPQCHGGAVYNTDFKGFIDYSIVCELDEEKFTEDNLKTTILDFLNTRSHLTYDACGYADEKRPLTDEEKIKCFSTRVIKDEQTGKEYTERKFNCTVKRPFDNKWVVYDTDFVWLNCFLKQPLPAVDIRKFRPETIIIDIDQTSTEILANYIRSLAKQCEQAEKDRFVVFSRDVRKYKLLLNFSKPIFSRFIPQSSAIVGMQFDVFGILKSLRHEQILNNDDALKEEFRRRESEEIRKRVINTLKQELNQDIINNSYFEVKYDNELHRKILGLYYFKGSLPDNPSDSQIEFLKCQHLGDFKPFCAPRLAEATNRATEMPYFWCRGLECFHNNLHSQILANCTSWSYYSLYHMIEIIGFPKLHETPAGYEPDVTVTEFIACANRVMKKFRRLKCRNCGHLMYTDKSSGYNRYNYYSCINPTCSEYNKPIYLSYCFKCKKGLIDSRDSKQCPNGWYICPTCLSCCDDAQYERQAQRYILAKKPIPERIREKLGHGHNDKGEFFCPQCGNPVEIITEEDGTTYKGCRTCKRNFDKESEIRDTYRFR